jgi:hypothetical protein
MITETRKVFALAALIVATGVATVELTRNPAQAETNTVDSGAYATARIDTAFEVVAQMPAMPVVRVPMAQKGDLEVPVGCEGSAEAECMDVAYEVPSEPSVVVETRSGTTSTLMRMDAMTVASGVKEGALPQSE